MSYSELYHYGIPGMKWGVRRFQNADGSYTPSGARRHAAGISGGTGTSSSGSSGRKRIDKRKLARNIAIGVGAAAAIGGAAYGIHRLRKNRQNFVGPSKMLYYADKGQAAIDKASTKLASRMHIDEPFNADGSFNSNPKKKTSRFAEAVQKGKEVIAERKAKSRTNDPLSKAMKNDGIDKVASLPVERYADRAYEKTRQQLRSRKKRR